MIKEDVKMVTFSNGRISLNSAAPFSSGGYTDHVTRRLVKFKELPLCDEDGNPSMIPGPDGTPVQAFWGQDLKFEGNRSISLHPVIHMHVIDAIRRYQFTVTSKKPEGYPPRDNGWIIEQEPEVWDEKEAKEIELNLDATHYLREVSRDKSPMGMLELVSAYYNRRNIKSQAGRLKDLATIVEDDPLKFIQLFDENGLKKDVEQRAVIKMAVNKNVINHRNNEFFLGNDSLGYSEKDILASNRYFDIHTALADLLGVSKKEEVVVENAPVVEKEEEVNIEKEEDKTPDDGAEF